MLKVEYRGLKLSTHHHRKAGIDNEVQHNLWFDYIKEIRSVINSKNPFYSGYDRNSFETWKEWKEREFCDWMNLVSKRERSKYGR